MRADRILQQNPITDIKEYLSGEKHQDVSSGLGDVDLEHRHHTGFQVICFWSLDSRKQHKTNKKKKQENRHRDQSGRFDSSCGLCLSSYFGVEDVHGEPPARDPEDGRVVEEAGEAFGVQSGAGHQHLQVCSEPGDVFDETEEDVRVEGPLMGLIDDDHTNNTQIWR